jgi:hypothetical protein
VTEAGGLNLADAVRAATTDDGRAWLDRAVEAIGCDTAAVASWFPATGRQVGRNPLAGHWEAGHWTPGSPPPGGPMFTWTVDDGARVLLLDALGERASDELEGLYRYGDAAERRAVLRWVGRRADGPAPAPACALRLVEDALRTNDPRLVAAALGPWAVRHLDPHAFRHAVLKCVFMGVPLEGIDGLDQRADAELADMLAAYVDERVAAGRTVPADVWPLLERFRPGASVREHS